MERGEVRWYTFKQPDKRRPVLILTRTPAIQYLHTVTVVSITTTTRGVPSEVLLTPEDGMPEICAANFYNLHTIPQNDIDGLITVLSPEKMADVDQAIAFALGMDSWL
ncbi:MAG: type II toxin-antitoxin system PemK/MazF family toxin [Ardenticatenaceae bacterium]|nr:type II toxin-antitoxin system PemK/MazF family toxin [Anaerolineales bacterium]MCB8923364.1 type II toxin-antitoxin system PemK/MazF family toxin [Ardenticatenaceae bacterium]